MAYDVKSRLNYLGSRLKGISYFDVTLQRGVNTSDGTVRASPGITEIEEMTASSLVVQARTQDWIIDTADYVIGHVATLPQNGDNIVKGGETFRVITPDGHQACYRYTTTTKLRIRVHTVQVG